MITDSSIWKNEIENQISSINLSLNNGNNKMIKNGEDDFHLFIYIELQKFTIYTSIIIRKLIEANKISEELLNKNYPIISFKRNQKQMTVLNCYEIEKLYDLDQANKSSVSIKNLSHILIHSYHFIPYYNYPNTELAVEEEKPTGFYYTSDKIKQDNICLITLNQYFEILREIIFDFITYVEFDNGNITKVSSRKTK